MKTERIMLGNLFQERYTREIIRVVALDSEKDTVTFSGDFKGKWQAEPIILTDEIVKEYGYIWNASLLCYEYPGHILMSLQFSDFGVKMMNPILRSFTVPQNFNYLHELQNIAQFVGRVNLSKTQKP